MLWGVPAATISPVDHRPDVVIEASASTTTPTQLDLVPRWAPGAPSSLLALSSTTVGTVAVAIESAAPSNAVNGHSFDLTSDDDAEEWPVATEAKPKAVLPMKGRIVRVIRPKYEAVGLPSSDDILDDHE